MKENEEIKMENSLILELILAMDVYYYTIQSVVKEHNIKGTCKSIIINAFKGRTFIFYSENETNILEISKVKVGSFGVKMFIKGNNKGGICISYDRLKNLLKD